jgi:DNA-binding response OmpR family regulator
MKALVVDDDLALSDVLAFTMRRAGFQVIAAHDGQEALELWKTGSPDLVILDLNLPKLDGLSVCKWIRSRSNVPIIILSVRSDEEDVIEGLRLGADDYMVKPFSPRELVARADAVIRRANSSPEIQDTIVAGLYLLDLRKNELLIGEGESIQVTRLEARLLDILMRNAGHVVSTSALIDYIWEPAGGDRKMLKQLIYRLRRKIEPDMDIPVLIQTVSNLGYIFVQKA